MYVMRPYPYSPLIALAVAVVVLIGGLYYEHTQLQNISASVNVLQTNLTQLALAVSTTSKTASSTAADIAALAARGQSQPVAPAPSQGQMLEDAVAKVSPAVVSIVESQVVPQLQVTYENPFGNDPFYRGFGIQVPVYRQVGTTTQQVAAGTGFLVRSNGYIVTNKHVVGDTNATYTVLLSNGKQLPGTVVWRSQSEDLAVVKIGGSGYATIALGDSSSLRLAQSVFAIGNALGKYNNSVSTGVISGLNRTLSASNDQGQMETLSGVIQTDAPINPGNSGGPLVDLSGRAVGVNVALVQGSQNIAFALPINAVKQALSSLGI